MVHQVACLILAMPEDTELTSIEDVLQSSELAARLLRRLIASPGVIDTQSLFRTYARLTELITHAHPLLRDLLGRYNVDDDSAVSELPFAMDQQWMLNLNTYLTNNNSYSTTTTTNNSSTILATTNNSFSASTTTNQSILQSSTSSTTYTELLGATSQSSPTEVFRVSRSPAARRQSVLIDARDVVLNPVSKSAESVVSPIVHTERQRLTEQVKTTPAAVPASTDLTVAQMPLAQPVIQRELLETEIKTSRLVLKDRETIKTERHSAKSEVIETQQRTIAPQSLSTSTDTAAATATPPTLPLVQEQLSSSQFQPRPQQFVWRKSADSLTLQDLVSDVSSNSPLAAVRRALESLPKAQSPQIDGIIKPEPSRREDELPPAVEEITTEGMLRRISKMLLIERERRGY